MTDLLRGRLVRPCVGNDAAKTGHLDTGTSSSSHASIVPLVCHAHCYGGACTQRDPWVGFVRVLPKVTFFAYALSSLPRRLRAYEEAGYKLQADAFSRASWALRHAWLEGEFDGSA